MPKPIIFMCMHNTMDILKKAEILKYYSEGIQYDRSKELYQDEVKMKNFESILGIMNSLGKIHKELERIDINSKLDNQSTETIHRWAGIKDELLSEYVVARLVSVMDHT